MLFRSELGRYLFYDKRLSLNQTQSCATCHRQEKAFTDGRARGLGSTGQLHPRGPMSLVNVAYSPVLTWGNPLMRTLEAQALVPLFGENPIELGMTGKEDLLLQRLKSDARYQKLFAAAFRPKPTDSPFVPSRKPSPASSERSFPATHRMTDTRTATIATPFPNRQSAAKRCSSASAWSVFTATAAST